jgi:uncharacterized membrane protein YqhA
MAVKPTSDRELMWYVTIHIVFVVSSVLLALSDRLSGEIKSGGKDKQTQSQPADKADIA